MFIDVFVIFSFVVLGAFVSIFIFRIQNDKIVLLRGIKHVRSFYYYVYVL